MRIYWNQSILSVSMYTALIFAILTHKSNYKTFSDGVKVQYNLRSTSIDTSCRPVILFILKNDGALFYFANLHEFRCSRPFEMFSIQYTDRKSNDE